MVARAIKKTPLQRGSDRSLYRSPSPSKNRRSHVKSFRDRSSGLRLKPTPSPSRSVSDQWHYEVSLPITATSSHRILTGFPTSRKIVFTLFQKAKKIAYFYFYKIMKSRKIFQLNGRGCVTQNERENQAASSCCHILSHSSLKIDNRSASINGIDFRRH